MYNKKELVSYQNDHQLFYDFKYDEFLEVPISSNLNKLSNDFVDIAIEINIPYKIKIYYPLSLIYTYKNCWIQYSSIFFPLVIVIYLLWLFFNRYKIVNLKNTINT